MGCQAGHAIRGAADPTAGVPLMRAGQQSVPLMRGHETNADRDARQSAVLRLVTDTTPNAVNGTIRPRRVTNAERRPREHLSRDEVLALCKAARSNRYGARDAAAIWLAFNHGLRVSELADLRWADIQWQERRL